MTIRHIGVIGLGAMGLGMARNLLKAGFAVTGYDVRPEAVAALAADGGTAAATPAAAATGVDALLLIGSDAGQTDGVLFEAGALAALPEHAPVVLHVTASPGYVRDLAGRVAAAGRVLMDVPITGGKQGADDGTLTMIAGGPAAVLDRLRPAFEAMGRRIVHCGEAAGTGTTVKMINQMLVGIHGMAAAEATALAVRAGANPRTVYDVITHGAGNSAIYESRVQRVMDGDFAMRGAVGIMIKDLGAVLEMGREMRAGLPITAAVYQRYLEACAAGLEQADDAAVIRLYERAFGVDVVAAAAPAEPDGA